MQYAKANEYILFHGKMQDELAELADNSVDSIVTDPPYEINFMAKSWDNSGVAFQKDTWERCLRVLKPGGYLLAFGGSRTFHRIACAIEDAGFEIRDTIMWLYGSGFPKSMNIGLAIDRRNGAETVLGNIKQGHNEFANRKTDGDTKFKGAMEGFDRPWMHDTDKMKAYHYEKVLQTEEARKWDGWGTTLKPSYEPIIVARKPCEGTCVDNVLKYGVGGLNIDECRIGDDPIRAGRFPANTIFTYDDTDFDEVCGGLPSGGQNGSITKRYDMNNQVYGDYGKCNLWEAYNDSGSAARYFYCAKASTRDRDEGCELFAKKKATSKINKSNGTGERFDGEQTPIRANTHATVKPTDLMQYLIRLVTPRGGTILDPFMGSGSTGKAAMYENRDRNADYKFIGIEMTAEYLPIAEARIAYAAGDTSEVKCAEPSAPQSTDSQVKFDL